MWPEKREQVFWSGFDTKSFTKTFAPWGISFLSRFPLLFTPYNLEIYYETPYIYFPYSRRYSYIWF